jgi:hypothetical protein
VRLQHTRIADSRNGAHPMPPIRLTDDELAAVMDASRPLPIAMRDPFLHAVAHELAGRQVVGPGVVFQVVREQQRIFMNGAWPDLSRTAGTSKWR